MKYADKGKPMKFSTVANRVAQILVTTAAIGIYFGVGAVTWPSTPLGSTTNATPMTMLVMGKDHKLFYEAYNDASDVNGDGSLDVKFKPGIRYYGIYDADLCYSYSNNLFSPAGTTDELGRCTDSAEWSGRWLNYMTTSRIDALRKVLYGGYREVDSTTQTVLRRAYIPQDAHSWGKEYHNQATDGYRISDYTPFSEPTSDDHRHFFGNLTDTENISCVTLSDCSDRDPLLRVRENVGENHRIWEWASKERTVLSDSLSTGDFPDGTGNAREFSIRVEVCTQTFNNGCKQYPNGGTPVYKPVGLLHDYGEDDSMYFGLLTGSYDRPLSGGRLRKVVSSFSEEVDTVTGQFTSDARIVNTIDNLRIRDFNNRSPADNQYRNVRNAAARNMTDGEYADWGNPIGEMLYEAARYFAGAEAPTSVFDASNQRAVDAEVGLESAEWDDPFGSTSAASAASCAKANFLTISDINPSYDSDQLPGVYTEFGSFTGTGLAGLNVTTVAGQITSIESSITNQQFFIGQSDDVYDTAPTPKTVSSLGTIRGLSPEEPTKRGSYYSASVARYAKQTDLRTDVDRDQTVDTYVVALSSPLPKIELTIGGRVVSVVPFAKSVSGNGITATRGNFQPTNQIVDFYVERIANSGPDNQDESVNGGRYSAQFQINFEDVEQGSDHDMDAIARYLIEETADGNVAVTVTPTYEAGGIGHSLGYVISGTTADGIYLVAKDASGTPRYFLNVPAGETAGHCDVSPMPESCETLPFANPTTGSPSPVAYVFEPSSTPSAKFLKDPLWYAAKYGGYQESSQPPNGQPDLTAEWDASPENGVPDTYFLVQNPLALKESLQKAFDNIIVRSGSGGNVVANSTSQTTESFVFQGIFNSERWSGDLLAYRVTTDGVVAEPAWRASAGIPAYDSRRIIMGYRDQDADLFAKEFRWADLTPEEQVQIGSEDVVNYLRGNRAAENRETDPYRQRNPSTVLGDIAHSSPFYVRDTGTVYVGANDGMLHAFSATDGAELFAYIPSGMLERLGNLKNLNYDQNHEFFVDGDIAVSSAVQTGGRNYLVGTLGRGGKGLYGLDVTTPASFDNNDVEWEYFSIDAMAPENDANDDRDLGYMLGRPLIAQLVNGTWAVIVGNGYNSIDQKAVLYVFNLITGDLIRKLDTQEAGDNGLSTPGLLFNSQGRVTMAYAGDLKGNVWKFSLESANSAQWTVDNNGNPLFTAETASTDANGDIITTPQPITAPISLTVKTEAEFEGDPNVGELFLHFGTGSDFQVSDPVNTDQQSWYGLIDRDSTILPSDLLTTPGFLNTTGEIAGRTVRVLNEVEPSSMNATRRGWVIDLPTSGERMVTSSKVFPLVVPALLASSVIPSEDVCESEGTGFINAVNPFTGGRLSEAIFDIDNDESFTDDTVAITGEPEGAFPGSIDPGVGKPGELVLVGQRLITGGSKGTVGDVRVNLGSPVAAGSRGRISWREIVR